MNPHRIADALAQLARRVRCLDPASRRDPVRYHEDRDEIAHELEVIVGALGLKVEPRSPDVVSKTLPVVAIVGEQIINGRRVLVQRRRASFRISV